MKTLMTLISILLITCNLSAQKIATKKVKIDPFGTFNNLILLQNGEKSFIISKFKTTNKEYLCFLQWTYRVFVLDYPEVYIEMLPDTITYPDIFDPEKSNMPVKGISKNQAQAFCQWRSDRLNEYILIREGLLDVNFNQMPDDNFTTESYLTGQYQGLVIVDLWDKYINESRKVIHSDFILIPGFYIATKEQIEICDSLHKLANIKSPKKIKSDLDWWIINELIFSEGGWLDHIPPFELYKSKLAGNTLSGKQEIKSFIKKQQKELAAQTISFDATGAIVFDKDYRISNLYKFKSELRYYRLISDSTANPFVWKAPNFEEKDSLCKMDYVYIADNFDGTPICIYKSAFEDKTADDISNTGFYCVMNVPFRIFWELQKSSLLDFPNKLYRY